MTDSIDSNVHLRINVWGINYAPELTGIGVYTSELCSYLLESGDQVTVVTAFPYYPSWHKSESDKWPPWRKDVIGGIDVHRCWLYVPERPTTLGRIIHELSFVKTSFLMQLCLPAPDVYLVISPPLLLGLAAWIISLIKDAPFVFHVQDLQPDAALGMKMIKAGPATRLLYWLERLAYDKSLVVSGISREMCARFNEKGVPAGKVVYFPNWIDVDGVYGATIRGWKSRVGLKPETRLVTYSGNLGVKQAVDTIVEAARQLSDQPSLEFVIAGNGAERYRLQSLIATSELKNIMLLDVLPEEEHTALLRDSDLCLITQRRGAAASFLPSKLLKTLALGRPVITNAEPGSPLWSAVQQGGFGWAVEPDDQTALSTAIRELIGDDEALSAMGKAGRQYVRQFDKKSVLSHFRQFLSRILRKR